MRDICLPVQDLRRLRWDERTVTSGTSGTFPKARQSGSGAQYYYKMSCYDSYRGIYGHECVNEIIASRLMDELGVPHADYRLVHARVLVDGVEHITWITVSPSYRGTDDRKQALDLFYDLNRRPRESPLDFCRRMGWGRDIAQMMAVDYLIANRDRHGANIEVLRDTEGSVRLAPLFDNGLSFVFSCYGDETRAAAFDPLEDVNANNYLGTRSLAENLQFIPGLAGGSLKLPELGEESFGRIMEGLSAVLSQAHCVAIEKMLRLRWAELVHSGMVQVMQRGAAR